MNLNANNEPIDEYNQHDLPDAEREQMLDELAGYWTKKALRKKLVELYWHDQYNMYEVLDNKELQEEYEVMQRNRDENF